MNHQKWFSTTSRNRLSDRDMLLDLMMTEKHLSSLYEHGVLEATSPMVSNTFERLQADTHDNARTLFTAMQQRGWYNPEQAEGSERLQKRNQKQTSESFDLTADSKYAVSSGARRFGGRLSHGQRQGKSGIFNNQNNDSQFQEWQ